MGSPLSFFSHTSHLLSPGAYGDYRPPFCFFAFFFFAFLPADATLCNSAHSLPCYSFSPLICQFCCSSGQFTFHWAFNFPGLQHLGVFVNLNGNSFLSEALSDFKRTLNRALVLGDSNRVYLQVKGCLRASTEIQAVYETVQPHRSIAWWGRIIGEKNVFKGAQHSLAK